MRKICYDGSWRQRSGNGDKKDQIIKEEKLKKIDLFERVSEEL